MNCKNCNSLLEPQGHFCRQCGMPVEDNTALNKADYNQPSPPAETAPLFEPNPQQIGPPMPATAMYVQQQHGRRAPRRSFGGCLLRLMTVLVLLLAVLAGVWFLALRPTLHNITQNELNKAMTRAIDRIPPVISQIPLPPHMPLPPITETALQTLIRLNIAPADPVQDPVVHINQQGVRLEFTVHQHFLSSELNFPCAVSLLPALDSNGHIVARNVTVEGAANLVMSNDEMATLINQHLSDAMQRLNHPIANLELQQGELDITLR